MNVRKSVVALAVLALLLTPAALAGKGGAAKAPSSNGTTCNLPESNAEALVILNNYYPGYWWDHTDLTVAVQAHPNATKTTRSDPRSHRDVDCTPWKSVSTGSSR